MRFYTTEGLNDYFTSIGLEALPDEAYEQICATSGVSLEDAVFDVDHIEADNDEVVAAFKLAVSSKSEADEQGGQVTCGDTSCPACYPPAEIPFTNEEGSYTTGSIGSDPFPGTPVTDYFHLGADAEVSAKSVLSLAAVISQRDETIKELEEEVDELKTRLSREIDPTMKLQMMRIIGFAEALCPVGVPVEKLDSQQMVRVVLEASAALDRIDAVRGFDAEELIVKLFGAREDEAEASLKD